MMIDGFKLISAYSGVALVVERKSQMMESSIRILVGRRAQQDLVRIFASESRKSTCTIF